MIKHITLLAIILVITIPALSQNLLYNKDHCFTIVFYNVENLFDTINNPYKIDEQFLPYSKKKWNTGRYKKKINDLGKVISSININELPELISNWITN